MSEERLQEIKDSIELQYKVQEANDLHSFNIFTDEEQELVEEVERLNKENEHLRTALNSKESIIKEVREYIEEMQIWLVGFEDFGITTKELLKILDKENK